MEPYPITDTRLYEVFREVLGKEKAEEAVNGVKGIVKQTMDNEVTILATKGDVGLLKSDADILKADTGLLKLDVGQLKSDAVELKSDIGQLKLDVVELKSDVSLLKLDVGQLKSDVVELKSDVSQLKVDLNVFKLSITNDMNALELRLTEKLYLIHRSLFIVGLVQFLAIVGSLLAIVKFALH